MFLIKRSGWGSQAQRIKWRLCQILEHLGYPEEPRLERRRHCREYFSLDKWHHLVAYFASQGAPAVPAPPELPRDEQIPQAEQDEILTETPPPAPAAHPSVHMPEAIHSTPLSLRVLHQSYQLPQHLLLHLRPLSPFLLRNSEA